MLDEKQIPLNVLFISAWYPHRYDPMPGLFVAKHAEAVSIYCKTSVIYVHPLEEGIAKPELSDTIENGVNVIRIYYPKPQTAFVSTLHKAIAYFKNINKAYKYFKSKHGKPDIIHANILTRAAYASMKLAKKDKIPYVITEHWSRYLPVRNEYKGAVRKKLTQQAVKNAAALMPVSENLKQAMAAYDLSSRITTVVPNVVDDIFFKHFKSDFSKTDKKNIIHVSCFDEKAKNIKGMLRVVKKISTVRNDFCFDIIGDGPDKQDVMKYAENLTFPENTVAFKGLYTSEELATAYGNSNFLLLFSNYENAPVVINEAFATGIPVIATNVGGIPEVVSSDYGILVEAGNETELEKAIVLMLDSYESYNKVAIHDFAKARFGKKEIGQRILEIYNKVLSSKNE